MGSERKFIMDHKAELLADLASFVRIPSVSTDPRFEQGVRRSAAWLAEAFLRTGFPTVEMWETPGHPAVFAEWLTDDPEAPTVVVYGHHDVQPASKDDGWVTEPFEPRIDGDNFHGRGASDDKQIVFHLLGVRAHLAATGRRSPSVNLKYLIEGEEEPGSMHFEQLLRDKRDRLSCDVIIVSDAGMIALDTPSSVTGMRGAIVCTVDFCGPDIDIHSGKFGGAVPNPATTIARLVAALHDDQERVQIPGFYDDVPLLNASEREVIARVPYSDEEFLKSARSTALAGEYGYTTLERVGARPTAEVNGIGGGYQGIGVKTIIPKDAFVKLSFRLVGAQRPEVIKAAVEAFVEAHTPAGIVSRVRWAGDGVGPCVVPTDSFIFRLVTEAISEAFDGLPVLATRSGGSGPEASLQAVLGAPMAFLGVGLQDDQIHGPNEKVSIAMLLRGAEAAALLWSKLATAGRAAVAANR